MLKQLAEFREQLDGIMIQDIHKRIILFGYIHTVVGLLDGMRSIIIILRWII